MIRCSGAGSASRSGRIGYPTKARSGAGYPHLNKGTVMVEKVFRDVRYPEPVELGEEIGYPDWQLVPKTDESDLKDFVGKSPTIHIYPRRIAPPPLLAF
ncbi:unnamed protein product [Cyprideis torosa]|uniref:Uncharacterized protein n=1 Tax=Cyprideis torosa TaxID=163714 RepID=A0A7R8ZMF2_9CRUS|nr:unnamed protein product [Cyprideis torosa]CAG0885672.1 unnamed protein product [Cyprideis torosa]